MSDVAEVKEAIEEFEKAAGPDFFDCEQKVLAAARRWVRVVSEGRRVRWCETHDQRATTAGQGCQWAQLLDVLNLASGGYSNKAATCNISDRLVAAVGVEKETKTTKEEL